MRKTLRTMVWAFVIASGLPVAAVAQTSTMPGGPGHMGQYGMMGHMMMDHGSMGMMGGCPMVGMGMGMMHNQGGMATRYLDTRIAYLKTELAITEAQTAAWNAYVAAVRSNYASMGTMHQQMMGWMGQTSAGATQMLDWHIAAMESRLAAMKALKPAVEALYAVLSQDQKQKADYLLPRTGCMM
jgi:uncharacterized small protein (DUF1192 family)